MQGRQQITEQHKVVVEYTSHFPFKLISGEENLGRQQPLSQPD